MTTVQYCVTAVIKGSFKIIQKASSTFLNWIYSLAEKYNSIDLIHDIRQLCTRFGVDGGKMSRGISGGKKL